MPKHDSHYQELRDRCTKVAQDAVLAAVKQDGRIKYDIVYALALGFSLTFDPDLKQWIKEWQHKKLIEVEGLKGKERVPKPGEGHFLVWTDPKGGN